MGFDHDFRRRADAVRGIPLESILQQWGAVRDRCDKAKWHLGEDSFSITGAKFTHWQRKAGGGGADSLTGGGFLAGFPGSTALFRSRVGCSMGRGPDVLKALSRLVFAQFRAAAFQSFILFLPTIHPLD